MFPNQQPLEAIMPYTTQTTQICSRKRELSRRAHLAALALLMLAAFFLLAARPAAAAETLRFANFPAAGTFPCVSMEQWAAEIQKRTNGAVRVETYPGGTLLDAKSMVRGVIQGQADIGCISLAYHPGAYPFLSAFELPLGFSSAEEASAILFDLQSRHQPKETARVKVIGMFTSAPSQVLSVKPLKNIEDMKGMPIRSAGILADVTASMGANPVSMPQSDTPEALQKGVIQGVFTSLDVMKDYNFAESCRYVLKVDMPVYPFMVFMNRDKWDSLPAEVQAAIDGYAREYSVWTGKYVDGHGKAAMRWSEETYGAAMTDLEEAQKAELFERARPVIDEWIKKAEAKNVAANGLLEEIRAARSAYAEKSGQ